MQYQNVGITRKGYIIDLSSSYNLRKEERQVGVDRRGRTIHDHGGDVARGAGSEREIGLRPVHAVQAWEKARLKRGCSARDLGWAEMEDVQRDRLAARTMSSTRTGLWLSTGMVSVAFPGALKRSVTLP